MDLGTLLIALPVFLVIYQGIGILLGGRKPAHHWGASRTAEPKPWDSFTERSAQVGPNRLLLARKAFRDHLETLLLRSGNPYNWTVEKLLLYKEIAAGLMLIFLWQTDNRNPAALVIGAYAGFKALDFYLGIRVSARMDDIQRQLPGYVDILALTLESGMDLMAATERIIDKMKANALKGELQTLIQESKLGTPRKDALQHLAYRANLPDIQSLTSMIIQSEELGTSLAVVLRGYAEDMRSKRILRAEEIAGKAPVKLLFPMMVFFFPIVFVVIFGPLAMSFLKGTH